MPTTRPAIRAKMGSTTYFETVMSARELAASVRPACESERWASMGIEERMQREPNMIRIKREIVPYLARHPDRFFGSIIVLVQPGTVEFEPLENFKDLSAAYRESAKNMGFLTFNEGEHIALDGQHRLIAFKEVISGGGPLGEYQPSVGDDEISVLVLEYESDQKTRGIFNKVNRHAKPTGASDNIITSQADGYAMVTRRLMSPDHDGPFAATGGEDIGGLVEWQKTTISKSSTRLTTISALYKTVQDILTNNAYDDFSEKDDPVAPPVDALDEATGIAVEWWREILAAPPFAAALANHESIASIRYSPTHVWALLYRPVGQMSFVRGLVRASGRTKQGIPLEELVRRAVLLDWSAAPGNYWRDVLVKPDGKMIAKSEASELAGRLMEYLILPGLLEADEVAHLYEDWNRVRGKDAYSDPESLEQEQLPQDLPLWPPGITN